MPKQKQIDPVCGMEVGDDTPYKAGYQGETYFFCNEEDKKTFQERPGVYVRRMELGETGGAPRKNDPNA